MPLSIRLIAGAVLVLAGLALLTVGVLGGRARLRRNPWFGIRTRATMTSDAAFVVGNRAGAVPAGAAGAVALVGGSVLLVGAGGALDWVVLAVALVGSLVLAGFSGIVGDRAAATAVAAAAAAAPACAGTCAGCDLVAGCRPVPARDPETSAAE